MALSENKRKALAGELYHAFEPGMIKERLRCRRAINRFNATVLGDASRREMVKLWRDIVQDERPLPPPAATEEEDEVQFADDAEISPPIYMDYGTNVKLGKGVYINVNCVIIDTCLVTIGARTLFAPNVSIYSGTHPTNPELRDGMKGPENGKEVHVGEDVWIGGNVVILPGVRVGRGATLGAGSVVTKDVPDYTIVVGNPARILRRVDGHENDEIGPIPTIPSPESYQ
ncbi:MAG: hypothetical protein M1821_001599 [Bathelium mastoideum]|nr:MAG: hypothetical protein M1821_001599 [Bathelium mastoideum]KAI9691486.1 MAG: hypothetical protein M1822_007557 [Bathelium mastoideum]